MTPLDLYTAEEHQHQTWCGDVLLERTEHQQLFLHTNFLVIPALGLKIYDIEVHYRESPDHEFEPSFGGLILFDMVTNEYRYEEGQSGLYPTLHNYLRAKGEGIDEDLEDVHVFIYYPETGIFYSHADEDGNLSSQIPPPATLCLDLPMSVVSET